MLYNEQFFLSDGEMQKLALRGKTEPTRPSSVSIVGLPQCPTAAEQERHTRSLQGGERQRILAHIANIIGHHYAAQQLPYRLILTAEDVSGTEHPSHAGSLAKDEEPSYIPQAAAA
ncbi:hypothetical protein HY213_00995 [Candidatus Peregrinibacteria bacterium]|nr:hypothetical protein [Candidatus Peregrinibacteria bacterium]